MKHVSLSKLKKYTVKHKHKNSKKTGKWGYWCDPYFKILLDIYEIPIIDERPEDTLKIYGYKKSI